jgi:hypothetical protein
MDGEAADGVAAEVGGIGVQCDVGQEADVERLVAVVRARLGRIDASCATPACSSPHRCRRPRSILEPRAGDQPHLDLPARQDRRGDLERARGAIVTIASTRAHMSEPGRSPTRRARVAWWR